MKRLIASLVHAVDGLMPRARLGGRESSEAYARWEYDVGRDILARHERRLGGLKGKRVLDIGCGLGGKTVAYAEVGARVTGVDISEGNVAGASRFARARGIDASFVAGDAERLPFADNTFDTIIANDSLEHFKDPESALRELGRVVRPNGAIFLFFTPWTSPLGSHLYDYIHTPWCHLVFPEWLIEDLLERAAREKGKSDPKNEAARLMNEFHVELNRITVRRYRRIVAGIPDLEVVFERRVAPKFKFLTSLARIPLAGELFTGTVVGILRKTA